MTLVKHKKIRNTGMWQHKRRINTEGRRCRLGDRIDSTPCRASYCILHHDDVKQIIHPFLQIILVQNNWHVKDLIQFCLPSSSDDLCLPFCI